MKNKKIWVRIGSVLVCLLLVGALAVPAFADTNSPDAFAVDDGVYEALMSAVAVREMNNNAFSLLEYYVLESSDFFNWDYLLSGSFDSAYHHFVFDSLVYENSEVLIDYYGIFALDYDGLDSDGNAFSFSHVNFGQLTVAFYPTDMHEGAITVILNNSGIIFEMVYFYDDSDSGDEYGVVFEECRVRPVDNTASHYIPKDQIHLLSMAVVSDEITTNFLPNIAYLFYGKNNCLAIQDFKLGYISPHPDSPINRQNMFDAFNSYLHPRSDNMAYGLLQSYYNGLGDSSFFARKTFVSGTSDIGHNPNYTGLVPFFNSMDGGSLNSTIQLEHFDYAIYTDFDTSPVNTGGANGFVRIILSKSEETKSELSIAFHPGNSPTPSISYLFNGVDSSSGSDLTLTRLYVGDSWYNATDLYRVDLAFTVAPYSTSYMLPWLVEALFVDEISRYDDFVYSPYEFALGYNHSYTLGYETGLRYGYDSGYETGYNDGFANGTANSEYDVAYQKGFQDALNEVDSGDFGRNFLGVVFNAPIDALNNFILIDWTLSNGEQVTITLGSILGAALAVVLVVWFLKLFAGG